MKSSGTQVRLLLVDDSDEFLRAEAAWLDRRPEFLVVGMARSGEEALDAALRFCPDIVLMDLTMPGMGGLEAIRALKARTADLAVVAVSLHDSQAVRSEASLAGADAFVPKAQVSNLLLPILQELSAGQIAKAKR